MDWQRFNVPTCLWQILAITILFLEKNWINDSVPLELFNEIDSLIRFNGMKIPRQSIHIHVELFNELL